MTYVLNFLGPKVFLTQIFFDPNFFLTQAYLDQKVSWTLYFCIFWFSFVCYGFIATLGSNLDFESKLSSEEPEWVLKSPW